MPCWVTSGKWLNLSRHQFPALRNVDANTDFEATQPFAERVEQSRGTKGRLVTVHAVQKGWAPSQYEAAGSLGSQQLNEDARPRVLRPLILPGCWRK